MGFLLSFSGLLDNGRESNLHISHKSYAFFLCISPFVPKSTVQGLSREEQKLRRILTNCNFDCLCFIQRSYVLIRFFVKFPKSCFQQATPAIFLVHILKSYAFEFQKEILPFRESLIKPVCVHCIMGILPINDWFYIKLSRIYSITNVWRILHNDY